MREDADKEQTFIEECCMMGKINVVRSPQHFFVTSNLVLNLGKLHCTAAFVRSTSFTEEEA